MTGRELTDRLGTSGRTLRRDVARLRSYGYSIEARTGIDGNYRLLDGHTMAPLLLDDDEALATALALASLAATGPGTASNPNGGLDQAADRALAKLDLVTPAPLRRRTAALRASLEASPQLAPSVDIDHLLTITDAIGALEIVTFAYTDSHGAASTRRVEPHHQVHHQLRWYLVAWDLERADWRSFRLDRMTDPQRTGHTFHRRQLPTDTAVDLLRSGIRRNQQHVRVTVEAPPEDVVAALSYRDVEIKAVDDNHTALSLWIDNWQWLVLLLAQLDAPFTIESPTDFATECRDFGRRLIESAAPDCALNAPHSS